MKKRLRILADQDIPYLHKLFGLTNKLELVEGRSIPYRKLKDIDILIVRSITKVNQTLLHDSSVKFIGTVTSGIDHIDLNYLQKYDIECVSTPGSNAISVVEYVLTALFWLAQRDHFFLKDKTVGIIGLGHIGSLLYERLNNFGVCTLLYDPYLSRICTTKSWNSLETLISQSDIVTLHTPLTYNGSYPTWHMIHQDLLDALPSYSTLINTSRGAVIDNMALLNTLQKGKKINVILDVWELEPSLLLPLLSLVDIGTAHIAGYTWESKIRSIMMIYSAYCNYFSIPNDIHISNVFPDFINSFFIQKIDESTINQLIYRIYNIYRDHIALKKYGLNPNGFDMLRKYYVYRREWSALCIKTGQNCNDEILRNFGFYVL